MADQCRNCGAELFAGQQFCRRCGTPTSALTSDDLPTRILQGSAPPPEGPAGATEPLRGPSTDEVSAPHTNRYPPPFTQHTAPIAHAPVGRRRSRRGWVVALVLAAMLGGAALTALLFALMRPPVRVVKVGSPEGLKRIPHPPRHPRPARDPEDGTLDEADADVSDDRTVITRSYPLEGGASVSFANVNGDITVTGWDEPRAEVKIIKRGGSAEERRTVQIAESSDARHLSLKSLTAPRSRVEVSYEVRLPRSLGQVEINSVNSEVKLKDVRGAVAVSVRQGEIELLDVSGAAKTNIVEGHTKVVFARAGEGGRGPSSFNSVNGDIELAIDPEAGADLRAETVAGEIEIDEDLGVRAEKRLIGEHAVGRIGAGGRPVVARTVNGKIKINDR